MSSMVTALTGITIACEAPLELEHLFRDVLGWHCLGNGRIDAMLERQWGIAPGSAGERYCVLHSPGSGRGMVRIVSGVERERARPMAARWAGIEMIVSHGLDDLHARLATLPRFEVLQEPVTMDWSEFGSNVHRAFIGRAPGGTHLAFTMGLTRPTDREFPRADAQVGHVFELPLVTSEFQLVRTFYVDVLGMSTILESQFSAGLWHQIWRLPEPTLVQLHTLKGTAMGTGLGAIELTGYPAEMIDVTPPQVDRFDGGCTLVTYVSPDLEAVYRAVVGSKQAHVLSKPHPLDAVPYCGARCFSFVGPCGERVEIVGADWTS